MDLATKMIDWKFSLNRRDLTRQNYRRKSLIFTNLRSFTRSWMHLSKNYKKARLSKLLKSSTSQMSRRVAYKCFLNHRCGKVRTTTINIIVRRKFVSLSCSRHHRNRFLCLKKIVYQSHLLLAGMFRLRRLLEVARLASHKSGQTT